MDIDEIKNVVKNTLSEKRYNHSLCVMEMAEKLAVKYSVDVEEARLVGLTHDIAKEMPDEEKLSYAKENNLPVDEIEKLSPGLLHGKIGADICKKKFGFSDEMCTAISLHTTGAANMNLLSKILFVADVIGADRTYGNVDYVRSLAFENLDKCILFILNFIIEDCIKKDKLIHINTINTRNYMLQ